MKTSKLLITSLLAAAAMSVPAYAESYTITSSNDTNLTSATSADTVTIDFSANSNSWLVANNTDSSYTINAAVVITDATIHNGYSNKTYVFENSVSGSGAFYYQADQGSDNQTYVFNGDVSGYSGAMSAASGKTATFTFTNQTGTGTITATNASSILNLTGATVNNSAISVSTVNIGGSTSFVTTTDLNSGNIVLASGAAMSVASTGALDLSSSTLNASNGTVSVAASGSLNLSGARVTLGSAIANSGTVTVNANTIFVLSDSLKVGDTGNTYSLISGGNITDWSTLTAANFRISGATISLRGASADVSTDGQVAFTAGTAANLTWKAGASGTWDVQGAQNWTNDSSGADDVFYDYDSVKFDTTGDVTVAIAAGGVTADTVTISAGTVSFTTNKVTAQSGFVVENGATLKLAANNNLGGKVTVKTGGVLDVNGNQADLSTNGLTEVILAGGKLANNSSTSAGTNLQQLWKITLTADSSIGGVQSNGNSGGNFGLVGSGHGTTTLDLGGYKLTKQDGGIFYLVNTTITAGTFEIAGGTVQLEQAASNGSAADFVLSGGSLNLNGKNLSAKSVSGTSGTITLGAGTLTIGTGVTEESVKTFSGTVDGGSGTLTKAGLGTIVFSGNTTIGTYNLNAGTTEFSGTATITTLTQNAGTLTIGGATTVTGNYQGSSGTGNYSVLTVDAGASLSVGGNLTLRQENNNDTGATMNVSGNVSVGGNFWIARDGKGIVNINDGGTVVANTLTFGQAWDGASTKGSTVNLEEGGTLVVGTVVANTTAEGTSTPALNASALNLNGGTLGTSEESLTIDVTKGSEALSVVLGRGTTSTINTGKYDTSTKTFTDTGAAISIANVISGDGALKKAGAGMLTLSNANIYTGGTVIEEGTVVAAHANALGTTKGVEVKTDATLKLGASAVTVAGLSGAGTVGLAAGTDSATLTVNGGGVFTGTLASVSLVKQGADSTLELSNVGNWISSATVEAGTLRIAPGTVGDYSYMAITSVSVSDGAKLEIAPNLSASVSTGLNATGGVTFAAGSKLVVDLTGVEVDVALSIITSSAIKYNTGTEELTLGAGNLDDFVNDFVTLKGWDGLADWSYTDNTLSVTLTVPEPSAFGLLAGAGALALVAARRRRRKKA